MLLTVINCILSAVDGATCQALQVSSNFRELEKKYGALTSIMSSQNQFIARLEKRCQCRDSSQPSVVGDQLQFACGNITLCFYTGTDNGVLFLCRFGQVTTAPLKSQPNVHPNYSSEANEMTNDVQRDQSAPLLQQEQTVPSLPTTPSNTPTDPPFVSFPVTKTPGISM